MHSLVRSLVRCDDIWTTTTQTKWFVGVHEQPIRNLTKQEEENFPLPGLNAPRFIIPTRKDEVFWALRLLRVAILWRDFDTAALVVKRKNKRSFCLYFLFLYTGWYSDEWNVHSLSASALLSANDHIHFQNKGLFNQTGVFLDDRRTRRRDAPLYPTSGGRVRVNALTWEVGGSELENSKDVAGRNEIHFR